MISNIINSFKGEITQHLTQQTGLTPDKADDSVNIAKQDITDTLRSEVSSGNISGLMDIFRGGQNSVQNPIVSNIINKYAGSLITKLGLPENVSRSVATFVIPYIFGHMQKQTANRSTGDIADLLGGDLGGGLTDTLKKGLGGSLNDGLKGALGGLFGQGKK